MIRTFLLALALLLPAAAHAQDMNLLAPLAPKTKPKKHRRTRKHHRPKHETEPAAPAPDEQPAETDDLSVLAPLQLPTAIGVKVAGGVSGAEVFVDGTSWGPAPIAPKVVPPGRHQVVVKRQGYADYQKTVNVEAGKKLQLTALLEPTSGVLAIRTRPPGAQVLVDDKPVGVTPLANLLLPPGSYELRIKLPGYMDDVSRIAVRAGRDYPVQLELVPQPHAGDRPAAVALSPNPASTSALPGPVAETQAEAPHPWYKRWYIWAGVGVVAAAAVGVAAASGGSASPITAQSVCGGNCDGVLNAP
jgi:hypothetical protein